MKQESQKTLNQPVSFSGIGIHTGNEVSLRFVPAPINHGIVFKRTDLPDSPLIPAHVSFVQQTARSTTIGRDGVMVHTVEHVLAALFASGVTNLLIELSEGEPPIGDGSSLPFTKLIEEAGLVEQEAVAEPYVIETPLYVSQGSTTLVALPSDHFRVSYTLHYPDTKVIRSQYYSTPVTWQHFLQEIAPSRTFALYEEITALMQRGLIRGGSLENAVVIKDDVVFSKEGLRFPDEMVRHKVLDVVGDLALIGAPLHAHVIAIRSGHTTNVAFAREIVKQMELV